MGDSGKTNSCDDRHLDSFSFSTKTLADEEHVGEEEAVYVKLAPCALSHL